MESETLKAKKTSSYKYKQKCFVPGCSNNTRSVPNLSFHNFPSPNGRFVYINDDHGNKIKVDQVTAWKTVLQVKEVTKNTKVCSMHFRKEDYFFPDVPCQARKLRVATVPSRNLPAPDEKVIKKTKRQLKKTQNIEKVTEPIHFVKCETNLSDSDDIPPEDSVTNSNIDIKLNSSPKIVTRDSQCLEKVSRKDNETRPTCFVKCEETNFLTVDGVNLQINPAIRSNDNLFYKDPNFTQASDCISRFLSCCIEKHKRNKKNNLNSVSNMPEISGQNSTIHEPIKLQPVIVYDKQKEYGVRLVPMSNTDTKHKFCHLIKNEEQLFMATGIENFEILNVMVETVKSATENKFEKGAPTLNTKDRIVMAYVKLKQNLSFSFLAMLFECGSERQCQRLFFETIETLFLCFKKETPCRTINFSVPTIIKVKNMKIN